MAKTRLNSLMVVVFWAVIACRTGEVAAGGSTESGRRSGRVRLDGRSLADDGGKFNALGASLFYGAWAYRHDRPRLERNFKTLSRNGFDYIRVLGVVGDVNAPDSWDGRESDWRDPDYRDTIAGLTDLAYDAYGLRVEWTLIGDGQKNIPGRADRFRLVDTFLAMSRGREHKIIHFEIANEAWQNGFAGRGNCLPLPLALIEDSRIFSVELGRAIGSALLRSASDASSHGQGRPLFAADELAAA